MNKQNMLVSPNLDHEEELMELLLNFRKFWWEKNDLQDLLRQTLSSPKRNPWIGLQLEAWLKKRSHAADRPAIADGPKNVGVSQAETKNDLQVSATGISKGLGRVHTLKEALWYTMLLNFVEKTTQV